MPREAVVELESEVVRREVAVDEGQQCEAEEREHEEDPGQVVERHGDTRAEDVEGPDRQDEADRDHVVETDVHRAGREVVGAGIGARPPERVGAAGLSREPRGPDEVPSEEPEERQHDRPADPVPEGRHGPDERRVFPPALVRVDRDTSRLVREHRGELRVEHDDRDDDERRQPPDQRRSPAAHVEHRPAERAEHEARIREADDEPVVPAKRLQELAFLDDRHTDPCITGNCLGHAYLPFVHESVVYLVARANVTPSRTRFNTTAGRARSGAVQSNRDGEAADHDHVRVR